MLKNAIKIAAVGAAMFGASTIAAQANGTVFPATMQSGETAGLARGAPLPEGVYFVNTLSWGTRGNDLPGKGHNHFLVEIPVIAWSTPWHILGANFQILAALPMAHLSASNLNGDLNGLYNPFAGAALAWDLGGGFGFSYTSGIYFNAGDSAVAIDATTWRQDFAASYTGNGWNLTANFTWGITFGSSHINGVPQKSANGFNLDLTATKTFGKWELGVVGFGSRTYDEPTGEARKKQFALGPLVGYNFGPVIMQAYLTRDVYARNQLLNVGKSHKETRFWTRLIIPLWTPAAPAPLVTKY